MDYYVLGVASIIIIRVLVEQGAARQISVAVFHFTGIPPGQTCRSALALSLIRSFSWHPSYKP